MSDSSPIGKWWILVALVATLVFSNAITHEFTYDAGFLVTQNKSLNEAAKAGIPGGYVELASLFGEGFWDGVNKLLEPGRQLRGQNLYRPMMMVSLGALYVTFGRNPIPFNLVNLLFHVGCALLVLRLAYLLTKSRATSLIAALLFAAHPLHVEAVAYLAGLGETQSVFFSLAAMLLYATGASHEGFAPKRVALAVACFTLAMFTKESAAVVLVLLPFLDIARGTAAPAVKTRLLCYALFAAVIAANIAIRVSVLGALAPDSSVIHRLDNPIVNEAFSVRLATGVTLYMKALHLFLLPIGQSADYSFNQLPIARSLVEPASWSAFLVCALMTISGFLWLRRWAVAGFGLLLFLFAFGPVSNIPVGIGTVFGERLTYMPTVGLCLVAAAAISRLLKWASSKGEAVERITRGVFIFGLVLLSVATLLRNKAYASNTVLYSDMVRTAPDSARAHYQHGELQRRLYFEGNKNADLYRAVTDFREATRILPEFFMGWLQLGVVYAENGDYERGIETLTMLKEMIRENVNPEARGLVDRELAKIYSRASSSSNDPAMVLEQVNNFISMLEEQHRANPDDIAVVVDLASFYLQVQRVDDAQSLLEPAALSFPDSAELKALIVQVYAKKGDLARARNLIPDLVSSESAEPHKVGVLFAGVLAYYDGLEELRHNPQSPSRTYFDTAITRLDEYVDLALKDDGLIQAQEAEGYFWRGQVYQDGFGDPEQALEQYQLTVQSNPNHPDVYVRMAECLILSKRFDARSNAFFTEVEKLYPNNPYIMLGHATVLSRSGQHREAAELVEKVIGLGFNGINQHAMLVSELIQDGRPGEAIAVVDRAKQDPGITHPELENLKGAALIEQKKWGEAIQQFERALGLARQTPEFQDRVLHMMFQQFKTMLRVDDRAEAGFQGLIALEQTVSQTEASSKQESARSALARLRPYILLQQAWGCTNVASLRDEARAITLLEQAVKLAEAGGFTEMLADDLYAPLIEAYEVRGMMSEATKARERMDELIHNLRG